MKPVVLFLFAALLSITSFANEVTHSRFCQKDMQARMILIKKSKSKFTTIFYKQSEELISGHFKDEEEALKALADIEKNLVALGWNCKVVTAEYLAL